MENNIVEVYLNEEQYEFALETIVDEFYDLMVFCKWNLGLLTACFVLLISILVAIFVTNIKGD